MGAFVRVTSTADVKPGHGIVAEVNGKTLAGGVKVEGTFYTIDTHRRVPLGERDLKGSVVTFPWHGWQFEVTTGTCMANPAAKVDRNDVLVEGADVTVLL
jgi:nitrite reductase (NADH) small subunit